MFVFLFSVIVGVCGLAGRTNRMTSRSPSPHGLTRTTAAHVKHRFEPNVQLRGRRLHDLPYTRLRYGHYEGRSGEKRLHGRSKDV